MARSRLGLRRIWRVSLMTSGLVLVAVSGVTGPILHERFDADPAEDLERGATSVDGRLPAALETSSGVVSAPNGQSGLDAGVVGDGGRTYGGAATPDSGDARYQIDRLTTQPEVVSYDSPFSPSIVPFKRLYAFDRVGPDLAFGVADDTLREVSVGGTVEVGEDAFYGSFTVELVAGVPVRIPTVGPGSRLRALRVEPSTSVRIVADGADNWFAIGNASGPVQFLAQYSIPRATFGSPFPDVSWSTLSDALVPLPGTAQAAAERVLEELGIDRDLRPREALERLVAHFRAFAPSDDLPTAGTTAGLYVELVRTQKGVCRHRSYAFAITAIGLGIPTRLVHNEAHAWVEVFDGGTWHRIDLGGAAGQLREERQNDAPRHRPPDDPYAWPESASPGLGLRDDAPAPGSGPGPSSGDSPNSTTSPRPDDSASPNHAADEQRSLDRDGGADDAETPLEADDTVTSEQGALELPRSEVSLVSAEQAIRRGHPLRVSGRVRAEGAPCAFVRVDLVLTTNTGTDYVLGSLATDESGAYSGEVVVPLHVPVGDQELAARTPGGAACGSSAP